MVALHGLVMQFETNFGVVALQFLEEDRQKENAPSAAAVTPSGWIVVGSGPSSGMEPITHTSPGSGSKNPKGLRPSFSTSHLNTFAANPPVVSGKSLPFQSCIRFCFFFARRLGAVVLLWIQSPIYSGCTIVNNRKNEMFI